MPKPTPDITGMKFGLLTAVRMVGRNPRGNALWECRCDCGGVKTQTAAILKQPGLRSCGCMVKKRPYTKLFKHGATNSPEFRAWAAIIYRCHNPTAAAYKWYGARGIEVCDRWREGFTNFLADMGQKPEGKYSLDRVDNDKGYSPENCRWATDIEQQRNRSIVRKIEHNGEIKTIGEWAAQGPLTRETLRRRLASGKWSIADAIEKPITPRSDRTKVK